MTHPFLDQENPLALAHQGGGNEEIENSTAAFANAARLGYRYLDVDLQVTSDDVLVAHHDDTLDRLTDQTGSIRDSTWAQVRTARLPNGEPLAAFEDLLDAHPEARWNIEVKTDAGVRPTLDLVRRRALDERCCLNAFSDPRMWKVRRAGKGLDLCASTALVGTLYLKATSYVPLPFRSWARATQVPIKNKGIPVLDGRFARRAHRVGLKVIAWTIDEEGEMRRLLDLGVDGILTDQPTLLKAVLTERGQWE